jgi:DNA-binding XRE family transcriptional regulator
MKPEDLVKWRHSKEYTQEGLGALLGVTKTTVYRWEKGQREIPTFLKLALDCIKTKGGKSKGKIVKTRKEVPKRGNKRDL